MEHLAGGLGGNWETAFLIVHNTEKPRAAQLLGSAAECVVEVLDDWNVLRAGRPGRRGKTVRLVGAHDLTIRARKAELMTADEATPIMRQWLELGELAPAYRFREPADLHFSD